MKESIISICRRKYLAKCFAIPIKCFALDNFHHIPNNEVKVGDKQ